MKNQIETWQQRHSMYEMAWKRNLKVNDDAAKFYWQQMIVCLDKLAEFFTLPQNLFA
jgi:hypothetical protein